jgi:predicted ATP-binding protein involved in virulence
MRIDRITLKNFRGIREGSFEFPRAPDRPKGGNGSFNLLVGPNGSGKTSILEGLAVAAGGLFLSMRGTDVRNIKHDDAHVLIKIIEGQARAVPQYPVMVDAGGVVDGKHLQWARSLSEPTKGRVTRTKLIKGQDMAEASRWMGIRAIDGWDDNLPLISYYSSDRLWNEPKDMAKKRRQEIKERGPHEMADAPKNEAEAAWEQFSKRVGGYSNSVNGRCSPRDLQRWLGFEDYKAYRQKKESVHAAIVKEAMRDCLPGVDDLVFDGGLSTLLFLSKGNWVEFRHLSEGQRNMAALVGDIAWKAAQLNPHLGKDALAKTPGMVLVDELDMHLHPEWQRMIVQKLQEIFPQIQFICATHSPQIIGEVQAEEILLLSDEGVYAPSQSYGMDSNWVVETIMGGTKCTPVVKRQLERVFRLIKEKNLAEAEQEAQLLRGEVGNSDDIQRAVSMIERIKLLGK